MCPKCGAVAFQKTPIVEFDCGSKFVAIDGFTQSLRCRVAELEAEIERLTTAITNHHDQYADDLCWMDDDELYAVAGLPARQATTGDTKAMLRNCKRFLRQRCQGAGDWKSYVELEAEIARLRELPNKQAEVLWVDDATPFTADQVRELLRENERLRSVIANYCKVD